MNSQQTHDPTAPVDPAAAAQRAASGGGDQSASGHASAGARFAADESLTDDQTPTEAFKALGARFSELAEYLSYYISAKTDAIKVTVRNVGLYAALGVVGLLAGATFVASAVVLVCFGIAAGLAKLFGSVWAGALVAGVLFLVLLGAGALLGLRMMTKGSRERTVQKYGSRQQQQRTEFGTDVRQRAQAPGRPV
jgi:membrane protein implicated in regulation of membrane protease activity